jgi:hypothetical protein
MQHSYSEDSSYSDKNIPAFVFKLTGKTGNTVKRRITETIILAKANHDYKSIIKLPKSLLKFSRKRKVMSRIGHILLTFAEMQKKVYTV